MGVYLKLRIGIHTPSAGSLEKTALAAAALGANTYQIFSASPRMWRASPPDREACRRLRSVREKCDLYPLAIHDNYLINLAAAEPGLRRQSVNAFRGELERAVMIGAEYLVAHPGSHKGCTLVEGLTAVVQSLIEATDGLDTGSLTLLLENTAGAGCALGSRFEELAVLREEASRHIPLPIGFCLDTCHCLVSGYDVATADGLRDVSREIGNVLGWENVKLIHANDSKGALDSHLDRHANIGEGNIGVEGFRRILNHPRWRTKPFILETPVDEEGDDRRNLEALKNLCRKRPTTTNRSK
jgi:deoxyribonuclease IV